MAFNLHDAFVYSMYVLKWRCEVLTSLAQRSNGSHEYTEM